MSKVMTPEEIRAMLRSTHPADRDRVITKLVKEPLREARKEVEAAARSTSNQVEELTAKVKELTAKVAGAQTALAVRQRMNPQDMRDALNGLFATYNFSPAEELVQMLKDPGHPHYIQDTRLRVTVLQDLNAYVMPKLKSTEITGNVKHSHTITIMRIGPDGTRTREEVGIPGPRVIDVTPVGQEGETRG